MHSPCGALLRLLALAMALAAARAQAAPSGPTDEVEISDELVAAPAAPSKSTVTERRKSRGALLPKRTRPSTTVYLDPAPVHVDAPPPPTPRATSAPELPVDLDSARVPPRLSAVAASPTQIVLAWVPPADSAAVVGYEVFRGDELVASTTSLNAAESGLLPWREYCYTVRAYNAAGRWLEASQPACATTLDEEAPTTPTDIVVKGVSETEVEITWSPSRDDAGVLWYEVWREERGTLAAVEETHLRERHLQPWTQYCYTIRARDAAGNWSAMSRKACGRTLYKTAPGSPLALVAKAKSDTEIELSWEAAVSEIPVQRYEVSRDGASFAHGATTHMYQGGLKPAREYCYEVVAVDGAGNRSKPTTACATTPDLDAPTPPRDVVVATGSPTEIVLGWTASEDNVGVKGYEVLRGDRVISTVSEPQAAEEHLQPAREYCYKIRAFDSAGNRSDEVGPFCARTSPTGTPASPRHLAAEASGRNAVVLRWEAAPEPSVLYEVSWENDRAIGVTKDTKFTSAIVKPGERHCYAVAAVDPQGRRSAKTPPTCAVAGRAMGPTVSAR